MRTVKKLKSLAVAVMIAAGLGCTADAVAAKNVMCLKTNTGQYIEVVRVSMMVMPNPSGATRAEISFENPVPHVVRVRSTNKNGWFMFSNEKTYYTKVRTSATSISKPNMLKEE